MVERPAVNRMVVGSNPTSRANTMKRKPGEYFKSTRANTLHQLLLWLFEAHDSGSKKKLDHAFKMVAKRLKEELRKEWRD